MRHAPRACRPLMFVPALLVLLVARASTQIVFEPPVSQTLTHRTTGAISADVDLDGHADILSLPRFESGFVSPHVSVMLGHGDGTFDAPIVTTLTSTDSGRGHPAFINGDAYPDLALGYARATAGGITLLLGNGDGTFTPGPSYQVPRGFVGGLVSDVLPVDLTADGLLDFVLVENGIFFGRVDVLVATGASSYELKTGVALQMGTINGDVGDVNSDGKPDVIACNSTSGSLSVLLGSGDGTFAAPATLTVGGAPSDAVLQDFDGDGALDLAVADATGNRVLVLQGDGAAHFATLQSVPVAGQPAWLSAGALDGDGLQDLLVSDGGSGEVTVLRGGAGGTFTAVTTVSHVPSAGVAALADFDEDGVVDAAVGTLTVPGTIAVLRNHTYAAGSPFTDLGHALKGSQGYPIQLANGTLAASSPVSFQLVNALPGGSAALILGFSQINAQFKGGTMVPAFDVFIGLLPINGAGALSLGGQFPSGVPSGFSFYLQYFFKDAAAPTFEGGSSAVRAITP